MIPGKRLTPACYTLIFPKGAPRRRPRLVNTASKCLSECGLAEELTVYLARRYTLRKRSTFLMNRRMLTLPAVNKDLLTEQILCCAQGLFTKS